MTGPLRSYIPLLTPMRGSFRNLTLAVLVQCSLFIGLLRGTASSHFVGYKIGRCCHTIWGMAEGVPLLHPSI